ncbi:MAG TPA: sulfurtransferase TusA family protein [Terriglobia bacterium]|nr:sulfurtransferase TusA family protein [Terriglobia bacterium]
MSQVFDKLLDARGLNCPMPLVNARKEIGKLAVGQVLKVVATDRGSVADFQGWAKVAKNLDLVGQETESTDGTDLYVHYVKRTA